MNSRRIKPLMLIALLLLIIPSCVQDDDFKAPGITITEPILDGPVISIDAVAGFLAQEQGGGDLDYEDEGTVFTFEETNSYLSG